MQISNIVQETEAETRLVHMANMIFSQEIEVVAEAEDHTDRATESKLISSKDKVGFLICSNKKEYEKAKSVFSLCMALPGECNEFKDKIAAIFNDDFSKFCHHSKILGGCACYTAHQCLAKSPLALCAWLALRTVGFLYVLPSLGWHVLTN